MDKTKQFPLSSVTFTYAHGRRDEVEKANWRYFPEILSIDTLSSKVTSIGVALRTLAGNFNTFSHTKRINIEENGISLEGDGWRVVYGAPTFETFFPHNKHPIITPA